MIYLVIPVLLVSVMALAAAGFKSLAGVVFFVSIIVIVVYIINRWRQLYIENARDRDHQNK